MDWVAFENDRKFVLEGLRHGEVDYVEHVSEAAEADLFRHLISRDVLTRLAETYPTPRKKEEVPVWLYLASQISLKLHDASYHAFPYVLRSGGLITALGPNVGRKAVHPDTADVTLACEGFNDKNSNGRQTPCDQDFLRKFARSTKPDRLHAWFNREVPRCLRSLKLFDAEGLFLGDASYIFVPDNENYEDSVKLLFDEHNHPVDSKEVDLSDKRYQWRRCYKVVSLIHVNRSLDLFLTVAARVVPGNRHECPILYELVDGFVKAVDRGWMKVLMVDRGLIDGANIGRLKRDYQVDTVVPLKKNMNAYQDVLGLTRLKDFPWGAVSATLCHAARSDRPAQAPDPGQTGTEAATDSGEKERTAAPAAASATTDLARDRTGGDELDRLSGPLTVVINREIDRDETVNDWVLGTTSATFSAAQIRSNYTLRTAIEERHRQYRRKS